MIQPLVCMILNYHSVRMPNVFNWFYVFAEDSYQQQAVIDGEAALLDILGI